MDVVSEVNRDFFNLISEIRKVKWRILQGQKYTHWLVLWVSNQGKSSLGPDKWLRVLKNTSSWCIGVVVAAWQEFFLWWTRCFRSSQEFYGCQFSPVISKRYTYTGENNDIIGIDSCSEPASFCICCCHSKWHKVASHTAQLLPLAERTIRNLLQQCILYFAPAPFFLPPSLYISLIDLCRWSLLIYEGAESGDGPCSV